MITRGGRSRRSNVYRNPSKPRNPNIHAAPASPQNHFQNDCIVPNPLCCSYRWFGRYFVFVSHPFLLQHPPQLLYQLPLRFLAQRRPTCTCGAAQVDRLPRRGSMGKRSPADDSKTQIWPASPGIISTWVFLNPVISVKFLQVANDSPIHSCVGRFIVFLCVQGAIAQRLCP
jgi:hypothetical protein